MITFLQHHEPGYALRTVANARAADLTICFGVNFKSPGMILTHKSSYGKYFPVNMLYKIDDKLINELVVAIFDRSPDVINIAGNSLYSMREIMTQEQCNEYVFNVLQPVMDCFQGISFRIGGQSGGDLAGGLAVDKLGLDCICLAPKNWLFRTADGVDIKNDPDAFCARFGEQYTNI